MSEHSAGATAEIVVDDRRARVPAGITVAAALHNLGVAALRRSVRGDARGVLCGMGVCFECRVTIDGVPHQRACLRSVSHGMRIQTCDAA